MEKNIETWWGTATLYVLVITALLMVGPTILWTADLYQDFTRYRPSAEAIQAQNQWIAERRAVKYSRAGQARALCLEAYGDQYLSMVGKGCMK